jgi:hypothetical protein
MNMNSVQAFVSFILYLSISPDTINHLDLVYKSNFMTALKAMQFLSLSPVPSRRIGDVKVGKTLRIFYFTAQIC